MDKVVLESIAALKAYAGSPAVTTPALVLDQSVIDTFARITHDEQWIHVDPVRAKAESPFGTTIAHGLLTLSLLPGMYHRTFEFPGRKLALNYGFDKVRFTSPVPSGASLVGSFELVKVEDVRENEARCFWRVEVRAEGSERPALVADWLMQIRY